MANHLRILAWAALLAAAAGTARGDAEVGAQPISGLGEGVAVCEHIPPLRYPSALEDSGLGGTVLVRAYVDETGRVYDTELVESVLPELFIVEALKTARLSRFRPAFRRGRGQRASVLLPMIFRPRPGAQPAPRTAPVLEPEPASIEAPVDTLPRQAPPAAAIHSPVETPATAGTLQVADAGFGKGVRDLALRERGTVFAEGDRVYFWMSVTGALDGQKLKHVWIYRGRAVQEIELTMKAESWRSWSYKTLFPGMTGAWLLELRDMEGHLLGNWSFHCE